MSEISESEYKTLLAEGGKLVALDPEPGTKEADRLIKIATIVEAYEDKHFPFDEPTPEALEKFRREEAANNGLPHDWQLKQVGNWFSEYKCQRCGYEFVEDPDDNIVKPEFGCIRQEDDGY